MPAYIPAARAATIASGQTVSGAIDLQGAPLLGIQTPAALTGTAFSFQVSADGATYTALNDASTNAAISYSVSASKGYSFDPIIFLGWRYLKVVSNAAEAADRTITVVSRVVQ